MRIAVGLVATLSALVLSLLISSGKSSLDLVNTALQHNSVAMIQLDRTLSQFGPSAEGLRVDIKNDYARWIAFLFSNERGTTAEAESREILASTYDIQGRIFALQTLGPSQEKLRDHAMELWDDIFAGRWFALEHRRGSIPTPLIAILVGWLVDRHIRHIRLQCAKKLEHVRRISSLRLIGDDRRVCCPRSRHAISGNGQCVEDADDGCAQVHRALTQCISAAMSLALPLRNCGGIDDARWHIYSDLPDSPIRTRARTGGVEAFQSARDIRDRSDALGRTLCRACKRVGAVRGWENGLTPHPPGGKR